MFYYLHQVEMFHPKVHEGHTVHSGIGGISLDIQTYQIYKVKFTKKKTTTHRHPGKILELDTNSV